MKSKKKVVSIITINYNGMRDTCELIDSLAENEVYPYEVIVVDNASRNDEASKLQKRYVDIRVVSSPVNLGFAGGNNLGYSFVESDYVLFLNNDIIITELLIKYCGLYKSRNNLKGICYENEKVIPVHDVSLYDNSTNTSEHIRC